VWWCTPVILNAKDKGQEANLDYINPVSNTPKQTKKTPEFSPYTRKAMVPHV
jgi:hypothetical protein